MKFNKTVIAVDMDEEVLKTLSQINNLPFSKDDEIHLVHVFELNYFNFDFLPTLKPSPENIYLIEKLMEEKLKNVAKILGFENHEKVITKCLFSGNAKQELLDYADKNGATVIIAAAKEKKGFTGLFESSFTNFLNKFSRSNLIVLRPQN